MEDARMSSKKPLVLVADDSDEMREMVASHLHSARNPAFADLVKLLNGHVRTFAEASHLDLGRKPRLDSLWVNLLKPGGTHSGHIHPHSIISGSFYVAVPPGSGGLKLEDPRLAMMMAAPPRGEDAPEDSRSFVYVDPKPGMVLLWESWLRHEVTPSAAQGERISVSFNYSGPQTSPRPPPGRRYVIPPDAPPARKSRPGDRGR